MFPKRFPAQGSDRECRPRARARKRHLPCNISQRPVAQREIRRGSPVAISSLYYNVALLRKFRRASNPDNSCLEIKASGPQRRGRRRTEWVVPARRPIPNVPDCSAHESCTGAAARVIGDRFCALELVTLPVAPTITRLDGSPLDDSQRPKSRNPFRPILPYGRKCNSGGFAHWPH